MIALLLTLALHQDGPDVVAVAPWLDATADPDLGVLVHRRFYQPDRVVTEATGDFRAMVAAWPSRNRLEVVGRTRDGRVWAPTDDGDPLALLGWDGKNWTRSVAACDAEVAKELRRLRAGAVWMDPLRHVREKDADFLLQRFGAFGYAGGGAWSFAAAAPLWSEGVVNSPQLRFWREPAAAFVFSVKGDGAIEWKDGAWRDARDRFPAAVAKERLHAVRFAGGAVVQFTASGGVRWQGAATPEQIDGWIAALDDADPEARERAAARLAGHLDAVEAARRGRRGWSAEQQRQVEKLLARRDALERSLRLESGGMREARAIRHLATHPSGRQVLLAAEVDGVQRFVRMTDEGLCAILDEVKDSVAACARGPWADGDRAYWSDGGRLYRWSPDGVRVGRLGRFGLAGVAPGRRALLARTDLAFSMPLDALDRDLDAPLRREAAHPLAYAAADGRVRALLRDAPPAHGPHVKVVWTWHEARDGRWIADEKAPTVETRECALHWCEDCHGRNQKRPDLPKPAAFGREDTPLVVPRDGDLLLHAADGARAADDAALIRLKSGGTWAFSGIGLLKLERTGERWRVAEHRLVELPWGHWLVDAEDVLWVADGRGLHRISLK